MSEENIATRLKVFFESQGLSNSQFADTCGIPRPTLSQILTGRNKKISDILIGQIHGAYPQLSVLWLLFGEGEMIDNPDVKSENCDDTENFTTDTQQTSENREENGVNQRPPASFSSENKQFINPKPVISTIAVSAPENQIKRKISHITVYYDDSTFETFYPRK